MVSVRGTLERIHRRQRANCLQGHRSLGILLRSTISLLNINLPFVLSRRYEINLPERRNDLILLLFG